MMLVYMSMGIYGEEMYDEGIFDEDERIYGYVYI